MDVVCLGKTGPILRGALWGVGIGECYGTSAIYGGADHREVDVLVGRGSTAIEACRQIGISEQTLYRWRKKYGGLKVDQAGG
jgi:hypothetical protein